MPCIDDTYQHPYFTTKITSSVMMAISHSIPMILHARLAEIYGLIDGKECYVYRTIDELCGVTIPRAMHCSTDEFNELCTNVAHKRDEWLQELKSAILKISSASA
jgi:hypothetical protein